MKRVGWVALGIFAVCGTAFGLGRGAGTTLPTRYVLTPPAQVRDLKVTGSDLQETCFTLRFSTTASVRVPVGKNLLAEADAQAREFAYSSPCAADLKAQSAVRLWRAPNESTNIGQLVITTGQRYCIFVWNTDS
jgi:hypothetical protein